MMQNSVIVLVSLENWESANKADCCLKALQPNEKN